MSQPGRAAPAQPPDQDKRPSLPWQLLKFGRRLARGGARRLLALAGWGPPVLRYEDWIRDRLAARLIEYPPVEPAVPFSLLTPVYDTPPRFLKALAASVLEQDYEDFEWILVDNGSVRRGTKRLLRRLEKHGRVRLIRLPENRGIVRGTRAALEAASGQYIIPVDHDDLLYPDALRVLADCIREHAEPALLYSDEDKLVRGRPACPFFKPDWDPALFLNCCYVTHLSAFTRELALELEAYTDTEAEGCPDWDAYARFIRAGHKPVHVPEVLYSWRVHAQSTSSIESQAKDYAVACQEQILREHLAQLPTADSSELRANPLFGHAGMWWIARQRIGKPRLTVHFVSRGETQAVAACMQALGDCGDVRFHVRLIGAELRSIDYRAPANVVIEPCPWRGRYTEWLGPRLEDYDPQGIILTWRDDYVPRGDEWPWEMLGLLERNPEAVAIGGSFYDASGVLEKAGEVFGYLGLAGSPIVGPHFPPSGYHGLLLCQRSVSVVTPMFHAARAGFLAEALKRVQFAPSWETFGLWLGAHARKTGRHVLYSPHIGCQRQTETAWQCHRSDDEVLAFLQAHGDLLEEDVFYGKHFSLNPGEGYLLTTPARRQAMLQPTRARLTGIAPAYLNAVPVPAEARS